MVKSTILIIAVAAVVVAAGAGAFFFANNGGDDGKDKVEVYRGLEIGDKIEIGVSAVADDVKDMPKENMKTIISELYQDPTGLTPGEKAKVTIGKTDYESTIYTFEMHTEEVSVEMVVYLLESNFVAKGSVTTNGTHIDYEIKETSLDPTLKQDEQVIVKGSYTVRALSMDMAIEDTEFTMKGTVKTEALDVDADSYVTQKRSIDMKGDFNTTMEVESIVDDMVTFKGSDEPVTMNEAMSSYAYDKYLENLRDQGAVVALGDKSSEKKDTEFGKREVTSQQVKYTLDGQEHTVDAEFGSKDVLYSYVTIGEGEMFGTDVDIKMTYTLLSCTAVTTEEI